MNLPIVEEKNYWHKMPAPGMFEYEIYRHQEKSAEFLLHFLNLRNSAMKKTNFIQLPTSNFQAEKAKKSDKAKAQAGEAAKKAVKATISKEKKPKEDPKAKAKGESTHADSQRVYRRF